MAAARTLLDVEHGAHPEERLAALAPADPADRALAWNLVFGVLRTRSALDAVLTTTARRGLRTLDPPVVQLLRVALYELRHTRVPPHAAVDQAVEASRALGVGHAAGFVNAVLRRQAEVEVPPDAALGHPAWLVERWRARYGADADGWMAANNRPAPLYVVAKEDPAGVARAFQHAGLVAVPREGLEGVLRVSPPEGGALGAVTELPGFAEGRWWVMDPAAVAVADLVGELPSGTAVLDTCAAPGGKSFRLASRGLRVTAADLDPGRLERLEEGGARLGFDLPTVVHDFTGDAPVPAALRGPWPAVLVDAPCTGLGTLRRHPDIRWRRRVEDVAAAAERQRRILAAAAELVAPGGVLVYAVCSPEPEEGTLVARSLGWPVEAVFDNAPALDGGDVFWGCRMRRPA